MKSVQEKASIVRQLSRPLLIAAAMVSSAVAQAQVELDRSTAANLAVEAISLGQNEIRVYWNSLHGAGKYSIIRDGIELGQVEANRTIFTDSTVKPGKTYHYSVTAIWEPGALPPSQSKDYFTVLKSQPYVERSFDSLPADTECDILVVGATTAGVAAAVTASRYGLNVGLIEGTR